MTAAPPRILLIEDDDAYAALVRALLPSQLPGGAFELVHEPTLEQGTARLSAESFDCLLLDNDLPDGLGIERVGDLTQRAPSTAVVLLSGMVDDELAARALGLGAQDALRKGAELDGALGRAVQDAVARVRAGEAVRAATRRVGGLLDNAPDSIFVKDVRGRYVLVNAAWSRVTGLLADDAIGSTDAELFAPDRAAEHRRSDAVALRSPTPVRFEHHVEDRTFASVKFPLRDARGEVVGLCGISTDVTAVLAAQQERRDHRMVLENLPAMAVTLFDRELRVRVMEGQFARRRGHGAAESYGRHLTEVFPRIAGDYLPHLQRGLAGEEHAFAFTTPDGVPLEVTVVPQHDDAGEVDGVLLLSRDVTRQRAAEAARAEAEAVFANAFDTSPIGMGITSLDGTYEAVNRAMRGLVGREDLVGRRWQDLTHPDDRERGVDQAARVLAGERDDYTAAKRYVHADGHEVWVEVTASLLRDPTGTPLRWFVQVVDVTERKRFEERVERLAHHDPLTGLLNRRGFERALGDHLARAKRRGGTGALLVLDLDGFKVVNDTLGHTAGDELIVSAATVLAARLRESDVLARLGGDEFAVLLPDAPVEQARHVATALCSAVREGAGVKHEGRRRTVTVSAGVVVVAGDGRTTDALLADADLAMYDAKEAGGDRVAVAGEDGTSGEPGMRDRVLWLDRLQAALEDERFVLHAQPIIDLRTGEPDHHELLIRLPDGRGGLVPPGEFLPIAERAGLIVDLDRWVLRTALAVLARERLAGRARRFSVNLSGRSIGHDGVLADLEAGLRVPGADPADLVLEMTETAAIGDVDVARRFAERLRELGVQLALDDFGVGFGSFYELKHLPCDEVKIDGEFVRACATEPTDRLVIRSLVELSRALGKRTVAEFVHDEATAQTVRELGVDLGQGFHLGRPVPLEDAIAVVRPAAPAAAG